MRLLILGATGPTGRHVVDRALEAGDPVTVLVRRRDALGDLMDRVNVVVGDATSRQDVARAIAGTPAPGRDPVPPDAIISALGRAKSVRADGLFSGAAKAVVEAANAAGITRLVWLSSFGVGQTYQSASAAQKTMYSTFLRNIYADKAVSETTIRNSDLDWTLVYPTNLTNNPAKGTYRVSDRVEMTGVPSISRADVAHFMHRAAHDPNWIGRDAVITD